MIHSDNLDDRLVQALGADLTPALGTANSARADVVSYSWRRRPRPCDGL